ncbi:hypothetical protein V499_01055 [Pseudogymnoascus sp. VKM F-103]|nr:hypothetical protein V499_01055 [Pseudogymnoascus sp. VKM F-103]
MSKSTDRRDKTSDESGTSGASAVPSDITAATSSHEADQVVSDQEQRFYYYGLSKSIESTPRLIARSGTDPFHIDFEVVSGWTIPKDSMRKTLSAIRHGSHPITSVYDHRLRVRLREALRDIDWTCVDVMRLGRLPRPDDNEIVVLVSCSREANIDHGNAMRAIRHCKEILDECGFYDVQVEMKEGGYIPLTGEEDMRRHLFDRIPCIGMSTGVSYSDGTAIKHSSGTLGLYLRIGEEPIPYGITCRHVVFPPNRPPPGGAVSRFAHTDGYFAVDAPSYVDCQEELDDVTTRLQYEEEMFACEGGLKEQQETAGEYLSREKKDRIQRYHEDTAGYRATLNTIEESHRTLGSIYAASADGISSAGYTQDWAMIKFDPVRLENCNVDQHEFNLLPCPPSQMQTKSEFRKVYKSLQDDLSDEDQIQTDNFRRPIRDIVPTSEITNPTIHTIAGDEDRNPAPCMRVVKCGRSTGWSISEISGIKSDCQRTRGIISTELCIPNVSSSAKFSAVGDSGSIIFDFRGRAVAMIHGGNAIVGNTETIVTYATPAEELLSNITQQLGVSVRMA